MVLVLVFFYRQMLLFDKLKRRTQILENSIFMFSNNHNATNSKKLMFYEALFLQEFILHTIIKAGTFVCTTKSNLNIVVFRLISTVVLKQKFSCNHEFKAKAQIFILVQIPNLPTYLYLVSQINDKCTLQCVSPKYQQQFFLFKLIPSNESDFLFVYLFEFRERKIQIKK